MNIVIVGSGRMGQGIAITFALAGYPIYLVDIKKRKPKDFNKLLDHTRSELFSSLNIIYNVKLIKKSYIGKVIKKISILHYSKFSNNIKSANIIFECVPEKIKIKKNILAILSNATTNKTLISSTTSTFLSTQLAKFIKFPERFLNAHWLNPPYLMPLIEVSPCNETSKNNIKKLFNLFHNIGKIPIKCAPSPGYIVPRIQTLAMNEAARIFEDKTASLKDIDKAIIYGFGIRFAVLGLIEFIDWGGIDTLNNASDYMSKSMKNKRFSAPSIVKNHIHKNQLGLSTKSGFMDWKNINVKKYQEQKLKNFIKIINLLKIKPKININ